MDQNGPMPVLFAQGLDDWAWAMSALIAAQFATVTAPTFIQLTHLTVTCLLMLVEFKTHAFLL